MYWFVTGFIKSQVSTYIDHDPTVYIAVNNQTLYLWRKPDKNMAMENSF